MENKSINNISFFANTGIGEFGTQNINIKNNNNNNNNNVSIKTVIANELLEERANIYRLNYNAHVVSGSVTDPQVLEKLISESKKEKNCPKIATVSPPCQGSSGLNAFKDKPYDFRNQLVKSFFKYLDAYKGIDYGYIENVVSYYASNIPGILNKEVFWDYIQDKEGNLLNYPYFILFSNQQQFEGFINEYQDICLDKGKMFLVINKGSSSYSYFVALTDLTKISKNCLDEQDLGIVEPVNLKEYIKKCFDVLGYDGELGWVRGDEYGAPQIRQRGFFVFHKKSLSSKITFPQPQFNTVKDKKYIYNGKTILDALLANQLIEIVDESQKEHEDVVYSNGMYYKDLAVDKKDFEQLLEGKQPGDSVNQSEMHFKNELSPRYKTWTENTPEGTSCYFNAQRIHRPYKIIQVDNNIKSNHKLVIEEDTSLWFQENSVIDYNWFLTQAIKNSEKDFNKESQKSRYWQIQNTQFKKEITEQMINFAKALIHQDYNLYKKKHNNPENDNELFGLFSQMKKSKIYYLFLPIKGFEQATYKRASLKRPSSALTTKMNIGNSNTLHPVFNRTWTPQEVMVLFGLGFVLENGQYKKIEDYKMPVNEKTNPTRMANMVYEICGEGIISTVAQEFLKQLTQQYLEDFDN